MGNIYQGTGWGKTPVGEYDGGTIYSGTGWNKTPIGEYTGSDAGAAALLLLNFSSQLSVASCDQNFHLSLLFKRG